MSEKRHEVDEDGFYNCLECDWSGSRSGYYKHRKAKHSDKGVEDSTSSAMPPSVDDVQTPAAQDDSSDEVPSSTPTSEDIEIEADETWLNWGATEEVDNSTHSMPTPLKALKQKATKGKRSKRTKAELKSARDTSKNILNLGLTFSDTLMTAWGRGATLDPDFEVVHSQTDKDLVSEAGVAYMEEKGIFLSDRISKGMVFGAMLTWYHAVPLNEIRKKSKVPMFKKTGGFLRRIPIIGRLFGRKKKVKQPSPQTTMEDWTNGTE